MENTAAAANIPYLGNGCFSNTFRLLTNNQRHRYSGQQYHRRQPLPKYLFRYPQLVNHESHKARKMGNIKTWKMGSDICCIVFCLLWTDLYQWCNHGDRGAKSVIQPLPDAVLVSHIHAGILLGQVFLYIQKTKLEIHCEEKCSYCLGNHFSYNW
jgi:hypothetical protein